MSGGAALTIMSTFVHQIFRKDVLQNILTNKNLPAPELFARIMGESSASVKGFLFETISTILSLTKCIPGLNYTQAYTGQLQALRPVQSILELLEDKIHHGDNPADIILKDEETLIPVSIKYRDNYSDTQVGFLYRTIETQKLANNVEVALIVKDKALYLNHKYHNEQNQDKLDHAKVIANNLLFDEADIIKALDIFCQRYKTNTMNMADFIQTINESCLLTTRKQLVLKLHQKMMLSKFEHELKNHNRNIFCLANKPRSGKSITLLKMSAFLLANGYQKILIMTPVPATIKSFIDDLNHYVELTIPYKTQEEFMSLDKSYKGLVFCSVQFLKSNGQKKKKDKLKELSFDAIIIDESHQGASTDKTKAEIIDADISEIRDNISVKIFASGTSDKTKKYYGIPSAGLFTWEMEDEGYMKQLIKLPAGPERSDIIKIMTARHGPFFEKCLADPTLNQDYSAHPTQVLMKHAIDPRLIEDINAYNTANGTSFGYNCASFFALVQENVNEKGEIIYKEEFELERSADGISILKSFFEHIISPSKMKKNTVMKQVEATQARCGSRISTVDNPLMIIVYLPTHTGNGTIVMLQRTIVKFLKKYKLWSNFNIEYSNSLENSNIINEKEYTNEIAAYIVKTKREEKQGCILLLGNKGSVGITYPYCDTTISLDQGHNLDNQRQRFARALTEAPGKTVGINVDMNIQRSYTYLMDMVQRHRISTKTLMTNTAILYYLFQQNIFLFDPQEFNNGMVTEHVILSYYEKAAAEMLKQIDDTAVLENIVCEDDLNAVIMASFKQDLLARRLNLDLEGNHQDCPKGDKEKTQVDGGGSAVVASDSELTEMEETKIMILKNETLEMCKNFMFPLLALISRSYGIPDFNEIFTHTKTQKLLKSLLLEKKIDLSGDNYNIIRHIMAVILDNNREIVNSIREIYSTAPSHKLRELIEKHFVPTAEEKKENAEVPTPCVLVDPMLSIIPFEFWRVSHKVYEPCCGKGQIVLGLFDKFYEGFAELIPCEMDRCRLIITQCLYYGDLTPMNVFITTELLKCHIQSYCGEEEIDYAFNNYTGSTLDFDAATYWNIKGFDMVVGNPPYNSSGDTGTGNTIWQEFTKKALNEWLIPGGNLVLVHPPGWRKPNTDRGKFTKMFDLMVKENQLVYLEIHGIKDGQKMFNCGTRYDWYHIEKKKSYKKTIVIDEHNVRNEMDLSKLEWLPNSKIVEINNLLAKKDEPKCPIMQSMSAYEPRKKWMSATQTAEFKYPCVHSTPKNGTRYMYSKVNDRGHFGIAKVIFGDSGIYNPIIDMDGKYGMTQHAMAIEVASIEEATELCKVLESEAFDKIIQSCLYSSFAIDWNIFKDLKKDFWKEIL